MAVPLPEEIISKARELVLYGKSGFAHKLYGLCAEYDFAHKVVFIRHIKTCFAPKFNNLHLKSRLSF